VGHEKIFSNLRDSTRRNVKKAEKEKVEVQIEKSGDALGEFCRLNRLTRREHGLPPQPYHFFEKVHRHIISQEGGFIALAYFQGKAIAGNVFFHFGDQAIYKYGASDKAYQHLRANNLIMWEAVKWFAGKGFKSLCFGRTELENEGLRQFKTGWGAEETQVRYFKYDMRQGAFVPGTQKGEPAYANLFRATPAPILNAIGSLLYRHMG
jgi:lipid II:glycine glycyltransferase (peptidoglycan interpeptide bridge formation enzyme)